MILLTGGSGLLGQELQKHILCYAPSHSRFDITRNDLKLPEGIHMIVHAAAYTDVAGAEENHDDCFDTNVTGTYNIAKLGVPVVYISTEYVFNGIKGNYKETDIPDPKNYYSVTKLFGEEVVRKSHKTLILRCVFKPRPFQHPKACTDQWTSGDYVDIIAPMIAHAVNRFEHMPDGHHILNIGTGRKSIYDLATQTREVLPCKRDDIGVYLPEDTSLDLTKWRKLID